MDTLNVLPQNSAGEETSPKNSVPPFLKHNSTPAIMENLPSSPKIQNLNSKKAESILNNMEANYLKLANLLIKDIDFVQWEPKVVSAAMIMFFRRIHRLTSLWNMDLEIITCLSSSQVFPCCDEIYKRYHELFPAQTPIIRDIQSVHQINDIKKDLHLVKSNSVMCEKTGENAKFELKTIPTNTSNDMTRKAIFSHYPAGHETIVYERRVQEKKSIFGQDNHQSNSTSTTFNPLQDRSLNRAANNTQLTNTNSGNHNAPVESNNSGKISLASESVPLKATSGLVLGNLTSSLNNGAFANQN